MLRVSHVVIRLFIGELSSYNLIMHNQFSWAHLNGEIQYQFFASIV